MNGANGGRPVPMLALQALAAFLLMRLSVAPAWQLVQRLGWFDLTVPQQSREADAAAIGGAFLLVIVMGIVWRPPVPFRPAAWRRVLMVYLPFLLAWGALLVGYLRAMHALIEPVEPQELLRYFVDADAGRPGFWIVAVTVAVLAPLAEEIVFRGCLQGALEAAAGARTAWLGTAVLFGIVHGLTYALPITLLGLLFGWLRMRHRSLLAPFTAHAVHNGLTVVVISAWPQSLDWLYPR